MWFEAVLPFLFHMYINDLVSYLSNSDIGIDKGERKVCILLFTDDVVLAAETAQELQSPLDALNVWYSQYKMHINCYKTKIMHFRQKVYQSQIF